ncbi:unnamed protein product, partial [marine sediment metagenome]
ASGDALETLWRLSGDSLETLWRRSGDALETAPETAPATIFDY